MVIAVTAKGVDLEANVGPRFGRAAAFAVLRTGTGAVRALDNREASLAGQGAGIQMGVPALGAGPHPCAAPVSPAMPAEAEVNALKAQAGYLEQALQSLRQRIQKLETKVKTE